MSSCFQCFHQNFPTDTKNAVLPTPPTGFRQKAEKFLLRVRKWWKNFFFKKLSFLSKIPLDMKNAVLTTRGRFSDLKRCFNNPISGNVERVFKKNWFSSICSYRRLKCCFDSPDGNFLKERQEISRLKSRSGEQKSFFLGKKQFSLKCS